MLIALLLIVLGVGVIGGGYVLYKDKQEQKKLKTEIQNLLKNQPIGNISDNVSNNTNATTKSNPAEKNLISFLPTQEGLPSLVEAKRQAIYKAALSRNFGKLKAEVKVSAQIYTLSSFDVNGKSNTSISGFSELIEQEKKVNVFDLIPTLLKLPYSVSDSRAVLPYVGNWWALENLPSGVTLYVWPSVVTKSPKELTSSDIADMKTFLTDRQIELFKGGYSYFNIVITSNGEWITPYGMRD